MVRFQPALFHSLVARVKESQLKELNLSGLMESSEASNAVDWRYVAKQLIGVKSVKLSFNYISRYSIYEIFDSLDNSKIETLDLSSQMLTGPSTKRSIKLLYRSDMKYLAQAMIKSNIKNIDLRFSGYLVEEIACLANMVSAKINLVHEYN
ncbi:hypothetical protein ROZALSC1DRAFT_30504 [Rozella allomycis CSF55]|nr:hypothetical protein ROZALSC1DRAFT_30504 [Rozella allomycis CSF55]